MFVKSQPVSNRMRPDHGRGIVGLIMAGNAWFTIAIILFTSVVLWRWRKKASGRQQLVVNELEFEDEAVIINSPVPGEEPIQRMPGPGNQPPFQIAMRMLSTASSGPRSVSEICQDDHPEITSLLSPPYWRNPQGRTPLSDSDDDESEQMSTAHVPGKHAPGETCTICSIPVSQTYEQQQNHFLLANNAPIRRGLMTPLQLGPSSGIHPLSNVSRVAASPDLLPPEGVAEANHTFSTFIVRPRFERVQ